MNICVCVKQVPDTTEIKIDPVKHTLIREGVPSIVNPYDTYALENAARIKDADKETKIVVISMGPEQAKAALNMAIQTLEGGTQEDVVVDTELITAENVDKWLEIHKNSGNLE